MAKIIFKTIHTRDSDAHINAPTADVFGRAIQTRIFDSLKRGADSDLVGPIHLGGLIGGDARVRLKVFDPPDLYAVISDVERHAEILPGYIESRVIEKDAGRCILQREAVIDGKHRRWKSEVRFDQNQALHFRQMEGPFEGMTVDWDLVPEGSSTTLRIVHDLSLKPWWKSWWIERMVAKPAIEKTARAVLESIKTAAESKASR